MEGFCDCQTSSSRSPVGESDIDLEATDSKERSPRYAQPVPVGAAEPLEAEAEEATEEEGTVEEPTCTFAQGYGVLSYAILDLQLHWETLSKETYRPKALLWRTG